LETDKVVFRILLRQLDGMLSEITYLKRAQRSLANKVIAMFYKWGQLKLLELLQRSTSAASAWGKNDALKSIGKTILAEKGLDAANIKGTGKKWSRY